jgi:hypothetical protein
MACLLGQSRRQRAQARTELRVAYALPRRSRATDFTRGAPQRQLAPGPWRRRPAIDRVILLDAQPGRRRDPGGQPVPRDRQGAYCT